MSLVCIQSPDMERCLLFATSLMEEMDSPLVYVHIPQQHYYDTLSPDFEDQHCRQLLRVLDFYHDEKIVHDKLASGHTVLAVNYYSCHSSAQFRRRHLNPKNYILFLYKDQEEDLVYSRFDKFIRRNNMSHIVIANYDNRQVVRNILSVLKIPLVHLPMVEEPEMLLTLDSIMKETTTTTNEPDIIHDTQFEKYKQSLQVTLLDDKKNNDAIVYIPGFMNSFLFAQAYI